MNGPLPNPIRRRLARAEDVRQLTAAIRRQAINFNPAHFKVTPSGSGASVDGRFAPPVETGGTRADDFTYPNTGARESGDQDAATWSIDAQDSGEAGVKLPIVTDVGYDHTSNKILALFYRVLTFDVAGRLVSISAESYQEVDDTDACS